MAPMTALSGRNCALRGCPFRAGASATRSRLAAVPPVLAAGPSTSAPSSASSPATASTSSSTRATQPALELSPTLLASALVVGGSLLASDAAFAADGVESASSTVVAAQLAINVLRPVFNIFTLLYIVRVPMTWFPDLKGTEMPWAIAYTPTEPILSATRKVVPLVSGVDVSPIVWVGIISFLSEVLLGPQGLLTLVVARGGM